MSASHWASKPLGRVCVFVHEETSRYHHSLDAPYLRTPVSVSGCVCVRLPPCVFLRASHCASVHTWSPWCIWVCKFNVSVFGERLNNAQRDSKIKWMSVRLLLANFLCDLLHSTVPVTTSCDTCTHTCLLRILNTMVTGVQVLNHREILCCYVLSLCLNSFTLRFPP